MSTRRKFLRNAVLAAAVITTARFLPRLPSFASSSNALSHALSDINPGWQSIVAGNSSFVQYVETDTGAGLVPASNKMTITVPNVKQYDCLVVNIGATIPSGRAGVFNGVTDSVGTLYTLGVKRNASTSGLQAEIWTGFPNQAGNIVITVDLGAGTPWQTAMIGVTEYKSVISIGGKNSSAGTATNRGANISTQDDNNFISGAVFIRNSSNVSSTDSGTSRGTAKTTNGGIDISANFIDNQQATATGTNGIKPQIKSTFASSAAIVAVAVELRCQVIGQAAFNGSLAYFFGPPLAAPGPEFSGTFSAGNTVLIAIAMNATSNQVTNVTETAGNTFNRVGFIIGAALRVELWAAQIVTASSAPTITVTFSQPQTGFTIYTVSQYSSAFIGPFVSGESINGSLTLNGTTSGYDGFLAGVIFFNNTSNSFTTTSGIDRIDSSSNPIVGTVLDNFATNPASKLNLGAKLAGAGITGEAVGVGVILIANTNAASLVDPGTQFYRNIYLPQGPTGAPIRK